MDPIAVILGIFTLLGAVASVYFYSRAQSERDRSARLANENLALLTSRDDLGAELSKIKPLLGQAQQSAGEKRGRRTDFKKQIHNLKGEVKALRTKLGATTSSGVDHVRLRAEVTEAANRAEEARVRAESAEADLEKLRATLDTIGEDDSTGGLTEGEAKALRAGHASRIREVEDRARADIHAAERQANSAVKAVEGELYGEIKGLRSQERRRSREVEQQGRRSENNQKAYLILQLQLDAALEKLALLDPNTAAPGGFYDPEVEAKLMAEAEEKRAAEKAAAKAAAEAAARAKKEEEAQQAAAAAALAAAAAEADGPDAAAEPKVVAEEAVAEEAVAEEPAAEDAAGEDAAAEEAAAEDAAAEEAVAEEDAAEDAAAEEDAAEEPAAEEDAAEEAVAEEGVAEDAAPTIGDILDSPSLDDLDEGWTLDSDPVALLTPLKLKNDADS
jgi:hypothetical protein